jgi:hypothetical protein
VGAPGAAWSTEPSQCRSFLISVVSQHMLNARTPRLIGRRDRRRVRSTVLPPCREAYPVGAMWWRHCARRSSRASAEARSSTSGNSPCGSQIDRQQAPHRMAADNHPVHIAAGTVHAWGAEVTYHRDRFCGHLLLHPLSSPMTLRWLRDRFARRPLSEHKTRTKWPTIFNPSTLQRIWACSSSASSPRR